MCERVMSVRLKADIAGRREMKVGTNQSMKIKGEWRYLKKKDVVEVSAGKMGLSLGYHRRMDGMVSKSKAVGFTTRR